MRLVLLSAALLAGCAVYQPPTPANTERAVLIRERPTSGKVDQIYIHKIDGMFPNVPSALGLYPYNKKELAVAPGKHTITVKYKVVTYEGTSDLWFQAEPGRIYVLRGERDNSGYKYRAWIEDKGTGELVGGLGPAPE